MLETGFSRVGGDAGHGLPDPGADGSVGVVVETVHALGSHSGFEGVAVPTLPDRGGAVVDGIDPAGVLALEEEFVSDIRHSVVRQGTHKDGSSEESGLEAVAMLGEIVAQACHHALLCRSLHQFVLKGEQGGSLHGVQDGALEGAVGIEEGFPEVILCCIFHGLVGCDIPSGGCCHVTHHAGVDSPVGRAEIVPIDDGIGQGAPLSGGIPGEGSSAVTLERFIAQPVGPLIVSVFSSKGLVVVLRVVYMIHEEIHGIPVLVYDSGISELLPYGPWNDDSGICPSETHHVVAILGEGGDSRESAGLALGIAHVTHPFVEEGIRVGEEGSGFCEYLGVSRPSETLVALRTVGRYREIV